MRRFAVIPASGVHLSASDFAARSRPLLSLAFQQRPLTQPRENAVKFSELLTETITDAEIPLRFEPGAAEAVARPVIETLKIWVAAHDPNPATGDFDYGQKALVVQLLEELEDRVDLPVEDGG